MPVEAERRIEPARVWRLAAYRKMVLGVLQFLAGVYELLTGEDAPKPGDVLRG